MPKMTDIELKALLQAERQQSLGGTLTSDLSTDRAKALAYNNGEMDDMPSAEGRSAAVSTDVSDTIEGLMPSLMEIFASGEESVRFEPVGPEDEAAAEQETDYVNHVFMQRNPGFLVLYTFVKDALLSKNGIVKVFWDKTEKEERETYLDQPDDAFMILASDPEMEVAEHTEHKDEQTGQMLHDVTLVRRKGYGCARVVNVPPEEFGISKLARTIADAKYCFHEPQNITEADLIEQGYDEDQVKRLPSWSVNDRQEVDARSTLHEDQTQADTMNKPMRRIRVIEHYVWMDYEGDGKPSLYKVTTGGGQLEVLRRDGKPDVVQTDEMPFAAMTPVIITHRFFGRSIAELVMDIQKIKTALLRNLLDNIYLLNNQRIEISEAHASERTLDDLLTNRPGGIVRTKMPGGLNVVENQPIGQMIYPALEYMDSLREWRSGVTRQGQGIDANALQNQSATAVAQVYSAAQAKMKLIARIFAETGVRDLFMLLHGCIRKNGSQAETVRLRGNWVQVDPRNWKSRDDMTVNVGLGNGSRQEQVANLMNILAVQKELQLSPNPLMQGIAGPQNIFNTLEKLVDRMGLKNPAPYFTDPKKIPPPPPGSQPPDPDMVKAQGQLQLQGQKQQSDVQIQLMKQQSAEDIARQKAQSDAAIKIRQQNVEAELERERIQTDAHVKVISAAIDGRVNAQANATRPVQQGGKTG